MRRALLPKTAMSKTSPTSHEAKKPRWMVPADLVQSRKVPPDPSVQFHEVELKEGAFSVRGFHQFRFRKGPACSLSPVRWRELKEGAASVRSIGR